MESPYGSEVCKNKMDQLMNNHSVVLPKHRAVVGLVQLQPRPTSKNDIFGGLGVRNEPPLCKIGPQSVDMDVP